MTTQPSTNLPVEEALQLLKKFSCTAIATVESEIELEQLRQALLLVTSLSESENLGICADNAQQGFAALSSYLKAFGYQADCDPTLASDLQGAIYIKFNTQKCLITSILIQEIIEAFWFLANLTTICY